MQHEQVVENLSAYIEGSLEPALSSAVESHIRGCADCFREAQTLSSVLALLESGAAAIEPPAAFHDNVMRRIRIAERERGQARQSAPFWRRWSAGLAMGAVAASLIVAVAIRGGSTGDGGVTAGASLPPPLFSIEMRTEDGAGRVASVSPSMLGAPRLSVESVINGQIDRVSPTGIGAVVTPVSPVSPVVVTLAPENAAGPAASGAYDVYLGYGESEPVGGRMTLREALMAMAGRHGAAIVAPRAAGETPVTLSVGTDLQSELQAVADACGMRVQTGNGVWYLLYPPNTSG